jgi:hypothetical protein
MLRSPGAFAASIPALVGFHPSESLVAVFLGEGKVIVTMRVDLPEDLSEVAEYVASTGTKVEADEAIVVICCTKAEEGLPHGQGVDALLAACERADVFVRDVLLIDQGRYWSFMCENPQCCPPEGTLIPEDCSLNAERVGAGLPAVAESRDAVIERYRPRADLMPAPKLLAEAESILQVPVSERARQCWDEVRLLAANPTVADDAGALMRARLQYGMGDIRVRDYVLASIAASDGNADALVDVVVQAALTAPETLRPRVAGAASALLAGCGESSIAVSCLLELAEGESLADLVRVSQRTPLPPSQLRETFASALPMVEEQLRKAAHESSSM